MRLNREEQLVSKENSKEKLDSKVVFEAREEIAKVSI